MAIVLMAAIEEFGETRVNFKALEEFCLVPSIEKFWEVGLNRSGEFLVLLTTIGLFGIAGEAGGCGFKEGGGKAIGPAER